MRVLGLDVDLPKPMHPVVRAVLLEDGLTSQQGPDRAQVQVVDDFDLPSAETDWSGICRDLASQVAARVSSLRPDVVVVRRADMPPRPSNKDGPRLALVVVGAVTAAAHQHVAKTRIRTGVACAQTYGVSKNDIDAEGEKLVSKARARAAAAALSGMWADRS